MGSGMTCLLTLRARESAPIVADFFLVNFLSFCGFRFGANAGAGAGAAGGAGASAARYGVVANRAPHPPTWPLGALSARATLTALKDQRNGVRDDMLAHPTRA